MCSHRIPPPPFLSLSLSLYPRFECTECPLLQVPYWFASVLCPFCTTAHPIPPPQKQIHPHRDTPKQATKRTETDVGGGGGQCLRGTFPRETLSKLPQRFEILPLAYPNNNNDGNTREQRQQRQTRGRITKSPHSCYPTHHDRPTHTNTTNTSILTSSFDNANAFFVCAAAFSLSLSLSLSFFTPALQLQTQRRVNQQLSLQPTKKTKTTQKCLEKLFF